MWPTCTTDLTPFPRALRPEPPDDLATAFRRIGWSGAPPVQMIALLGTCSTDQYRECPNLPEWHITNAGEDGDEYLEDIGMYLWCDFDLIDRNGSRTKLRMAFNEGDADCNDGTWGLVWDRDTAEVVANLTSVGDCEGLVEVVSEKHLRAYTPHDRPVNIDNEALESSRVPFTLLYAKDSEFEKLLGTAMNWCYSYRRES
jgi:hypothetical protein